MFEDTKRVIGSCKSKEIQCSDQQKSANNDLQNTLQKVRDRATRPLPNVIIFTKTVNFSLLTQYKWCAIL